MIGNLTVTVVLRPEDTNLRLVSIDMRQLSAGSDVELIQQGEKNLPEQIYGKQNTETWCYFFEKADLARQYEDWNEVVRLWEKSQAIGEQADNGFEIIPFIAGPAISIHGQGSLYQGLLSRRIVIA